MITRLDALNGLCRCGKLNVVHVFKFYFRFVVNRFVYFGFSTAPQFVVRVGDKWWWVAVVESGTYLTYVSISTTSPTPQIACYHDKLLALYLYLLITLDDIANLNIVVRLDVKTAVLTYGNLLHIILEAT